jgi:ABC-2 type transport system permease protein
MDFHSMGINALVQLAYIAIFGSAAYSRFTTKDILS